MNLNDQFQRLKHKKKYESPPGTADIVQEIYLLSQKDESGRIPVIIKPEVEEKKLKRSLN